VTEGAAAGGGTVRDFAVATVIEFGDLFDGVGSPQLTYRDASALDGRRVAITGFVVEVHDWPGRFLLVDAPGECPHCAPAPVAAVSLIGLRPPRAGLATDRAVTVTGRLGVGYEIDAAGEASFLRLRGARIRTPRQPSPQR
jgi:hypothetical protein